MGNKMKIIYFTLVAILISSSIATGFQSGCDKATECQQCQKTAYNLKFNFRTDCSSNTRCKSTCFKVIQDWNSPGSIFNGFIADKMGKCDVCASAGYCSKEQCSQQRKFEERIIDKVVDQNHAKGVVGSQDIDHMVNKIVKEEKVDFGKFRKDAKKEVSKALKHHAEEKKKKHVGVHKARIHDHHAAAHHSTKDEGIEENEDRKNSHESKLNRQAHHSKHRRELKKAHPHHGHHKTPST